MYELYSMQSHVKRYFNGDKLSIIISNIKKSLKVINNINAIRITFRRVKEVKISKNMEITKKKAFKTKQS
jgi:hypothetical protein